jgi:hypothetical protein
MNDKMSDKMSDMRMPHPLQLLFCFEMKPKRLLAMLDPP